MTVDVADINDEPPSFSSLFYILRVREDTSVNSQFEVVMATDGDEGSNAELTFVADSMGEGVMTRMCGGCFVRVWARVRVWVRVKCG